MKMANIVCADVLEWAASYDGPRFHALLCDPPYDYAFMGKDWDDAVAMHKETWAALAEHLLPGGFLMAFGGARTYHRLACAIEDAGLVIHPAMGWLNGQGFPKATRIDTQIDKAAGVERVSAGLNPNARPNSGRTGGIMGPAKGRVFNTELTAPATDLAAQWEGHRYGLQAIKPALEFIALAQKPYSGKPVESIVETGAGSLWIDGGRIGTEDTRAAAYRMTSKGIPGGGFATGEMDYSRDGTVAGSASGRWPANFALVHSPGCRRVGTRKVKASSMHGEHIVKDAKPSWKNSSNDIRTSGYADADGNEEIADWECTDSCPVRRLGEQSGERPSGKGDKHGRKASLFCASTDWELHKGTSIGGDKGTAARFFHNASWQHEIAERLAESDSVRYQAKAGRKERDAGLDGMPLNKVDVGTDRPSGTFNERLGVRRDGTERKAAIGRNLHPTIKPIALTQWLATLLLPPDAYAPRRILIPFGGSGSEALGAMLAGWEHITLVEMSDEYCDISNARLAWWTEQARGQMWPDVKEILRSGG